MFVQTGSGDVPEPPLVASEGIEDLVSESGAVEGSVSNCKDSSEPLVNEPALANNQHEERKLEREEVHESGTLPAEVARVAEPSEVRRLVMLIHSGPHTLLSVRSLS